MPSYSGSGGSSRSAKRPTGSSGGGLPTPRPVGAGGAMPVGNPDGTKQRQAKKMLMDATQLSLLQNNLRIANGKAEDLTIKRLTRGNETMKKLFEEARKTDDDNPQD